MAKASTPDRKTSVQSQAGVTYTDAEPPAPLGPALKQAVAQGQSFGEAHVEKAMTPDLQKRLQRLA